MNFPGEMVAEIIEARFSFSGKVVYVGKKTGNKVNTGGVIASLDRKILQSELNLQLADYEKTRARFEMAKGNPGSGDVGKFLAQISQSELNSSVKAVEQAKYKLDQADLISPVNGNILDMGNLVTGLNITPASNPVKIVRSDSFIFSFDIPQDKLPTFAKPREAKIKFRGIYEEFSGAVISPFYGKGEKFQGIIRLEKTNGLIPGMKGQASIN